MTKEVLKEMLVQQIAKYNQNIEDGVGNVAFSEGSISAFEIVLKWLEL